MEQAEARAGGAHGNKGWDSAMAALEMADLFDLLDSAAHRDGDGDDDEADG
jgi:6,7-dimethyl-8-ribityllumazine synthase